MKRNDDGLTLVEIMIGMIILAIIAISIATSLMNTGRFSRQISDRTFATQKCVQMMEELRAYVASSTSTLITSLDSYDDGVDASNNPICNPILTTNKAVTNASDPTSGNNHGKFCRNVMISPVPNDASSRRVYIHVYNANTMQPLAQTISLLQLSPNTYAPTQSYDMYVLALENAPGWWSSITWILPVVSSMVQDLEVRNPGLEFNVHYIRRLSFGRDPYYAPWINNTEAGNALSNPMAYFYPGNFTGGSGVYYYYSPTYINGRLNQDGTLINNLANTNSTMSSYSLADQFNSAMRYQDELDAYAAYSPPSAASKSPSLRMVLEDMNSHPERYKNIIILNLHGELLPVPPVRNYSDAAKDPADYLNLRAVSHPETLQSSDALPLNVRVYTYSMTPDATIDGTVIPNVSVYFPADYFTPTVNSLTGSSTLGYTWNNPAPVAAYAISHPTGSSTLVVLNNSPVRSPCNGGGTCPGGGLDAPARLFGLEYIPTVVGAGAFNQGTNDLTSTGAGISNPKNTARWTITIPAGSLAMGQHKIQTWINNLSAPVFTGGALTLPGTPWTTSNLSNTYVWVDTAPPVTEQYQFQGDARWNPYADVKAAGNYNWWFMTANYNGYSGFGLTNSGWPTAVGDFVTFDVERLYQLYRSGLLLADGTYTNIVGHTAYYAGLGGEIGSDLVVGDGTLSLDMTSTPWAPSSASVAPAKEIIGPQAGVTYTNMRIVAQDGLAWNSLPWLGELYPDSQFTAYWKTKGNLPTGTGKYYRASYHSAFTNGSTSYTLINSNGRVAWGGTPTLINGNPTGIGNNYVNHDDNAPNTVTGAIQSTGSAVSQAFSIVLPGQIPLVQYYARPIGINMSDTAAFPAPSVYANAVWASSRTTVSWGGIYYNANGYTNAADPGAVINMMANVFIDSGPWRTTFVLNGNTPQTYTGSDDVVRLALATTIRSYLEGGDPNSTNLNAHVPQLPYLTITSPKPTSPIYGSAVTVSWTTTWTRWDSASTPTECYPSGWTENTTTYPLFFNLKYSQDNGQTWHSTTGSTAFKGVFDPTNAALGATGNTMTWTAPSSGNYLLMVEAYHDPTLFPLHHAYHIVSVYVSP